GLHTGSLMMGIMGDQQRMEAGVVSDAVNTAARMEGLTKLYGASLIISGGTFNRLVPEARAHYPIRYLGKVQVKGRKQPMEIYDCYAADPEPIRAQKQRCKPDFDAGLQAYMKGEFAQARGLFGNILDSWDGDIASRRLFERSAELQNQKNLTNWDGVERLITK
ncbi:MAG: adenylate/guanylate cyclase domain-containing protein, partial [Bacteroidota bacterium]